MGYNLNSEGALGSLGSAFSKSDAGVIKPPLNMVICAITFLGPTGAECALDSLKPEVASVGHVGESFSTQYNAHNLGSGNATVEEGEGGQALTDSIVFPVGMTVFGRWSAASLKADAASGMICYFSY